MTDMSRGGCEVAGDCVFSGWFVVVKNFVFDSEIEAPDDFVSGSDCVVATGSVDVAGFIVVVDLEVAAGVVVVVCVVVGRSVLEVMRTRRKK